MTMIIITTIIIALAIIRIVTAAITALTTITIKRIKNIFVKQTKNNGREKSTRAKCCSFVVSFVKGDSLIQ